MPAFGWIDGFVHPGLALGAALAAVPLVIHLLNRQRHRPMAWAAMRFIEAAWKRTRRRARLEEWLLLCLRMAAVALLAFAVARPYLGSRSPLALFTEQRRDLFLILDASASTGYRQGSQSVWERICQRARDLLAELDSARGDRARVLLAGAQPRLVAARTSAEALAALAGSSEPTDERGDLGAALAEAARLLEEERAAGATGAVELLLLTDLQRNAFVGAAPEGATARGAAEAQQGLHAALDRLSKLDLSVRVEDLFGAVQDSAARGAPNLGVSAIEIDAPSLTAGQPLLAAVQVSNWSHEGRALARVSLAVDGERRPVLSLDVPARGSAKALFPLVLRHSGEHVLEAQLEGDALAFDDQRAQVVFAPAALRVLLVNGEPSAQTELDEVAYLAAALEPAQGDEVGSGASPFQVEQIELPRLSEEGLDLEAYDVFVLANVVGLSSDVVERLERRVAAGAGLILCAGSNTEAGREALSARLFQADGSGLLPCELGPRVSVSDRRTQWWRARRFERSHPVLAFFDDERWQALLTEVPIYDFLSLRLEGPPAASARALIELDDERASPLLVERAFDRGKVFLWSTTIDPAWARVAESARTFVPLVHEWVRYAGTKAPPQRNWPVGSQAQLVSSAPAYPGTATLIFADGTQRALAGEAQADGEVGRGWILPPLPAGLRAGLVRVSTQGAGEILAAVQADPLEGDLERATPAELQALHPAWKHYQAQPADAPQNEQGRGELWRFLAGACLLCLVIETLWAAWIGTRRARTGP
jgi:uncharacterized membrane protein